jgi:hypothetical protein
LSTTPLIAGGGDCSVHQKAPAILVHEVLLLISQQDRLLDEKCISTLLEGVSDNVLVDLQPCCSTYSN